MDATERARLRALCEDVALPLRAECTLSGYEIADANDEYIGDIETGHSDDDEWCDEVHADLIVGAVNALPALLDALDAAERERDEARAEAVAAREHTDRAVDEIRRTLPAALRLAAEDEREACAAIADAMAAWAAEHSLGVGREEGARTVAAQIRARGAGGAR